MQASQRGKAAAPTQAEAGDPLSSQYGDTELIQSRAEASEPYLSIISLSEEQSRQTVSMTLASIHEHLLSRITSTQEDTGDALLDGVHPDGLHQAGM